MIMDVESILRVCGMGTYLEIGCGQNPLVFALLKRSINAFGLDAAPDILTKHLQRAPERFFQGSLKNYPFKADAFETIIIGSELFNFPAQDLVVVFEAMLRMTKRNLVLYFAPDLLAKIAANRPEAKRIFWEKIAIQAGFRHHLRRMLVTPYEQLENEQLGTFLFFERIPDAARERFPYAWLLKNRDLHMDMLREAGRPSDAHVSRYVLAAARVRPGDTVLDAACGLGYGTATLAALSNGARFIGIDLDPDSVAYASANYASQNPALSYQACDVTRLDFLPNHSVDTVISFETIEHLPDYDKFLAEVRRVLKPDGRFIGSVPNLWCDETGKDPNPFHFHVFDWDKLNQAIGKYFIVDGRWMQTAGGYKVQNKGREMYPVPLHIQQPVQTDWWIFSACANPFDSAQFPYTNPFHRDEKTASPRHVSFEGYYDNPWLYRVMVQLGERLDDKNVLLSFCAKIVREAKMGSADQGAALCVMGYQLLESGATTLESVNTLIGHVNAFDQAFDRKNPHAYRWSVSLHYLGGRLLLTIGHRAEALTAFLACAGMDPIHFSPLLATKVISARMFAGMILASDGKTEDARNQFKLAVKESHRVLQGDWKDILGDFDKPLTFGLPEIAEVVDLASQCAQALHALDRQESSAGFFWDKINLKRFGLVEWTKSVERENERLRGVLS